MPINSRNKGARCEREFASFLREHGFDARRGQQFSGSPDSPDVVSKDFPYHTEVKCVQKLNLTDACVQAEGDCGGKPWIVAHRRNHSPWLITLRAEEFMKLVRETQTQWTGHCVQLSGTVSPQLPELDSSPEKEGR